MEKALKIFTPVAIIVAVILCITGCEDPKIKRLKADVVATNKQCPIIHYESGVRLDSVSYNDQANEVSFIYTVIGDDTNIEYFKKDEKLAHNQVRLAFLHADLKDLLRQLAAAKAGVAAIYNTSDNKTSVKVHFTREEVKEMSENTMSDDEIDKMMLENMVALENNACPIDLGDGLVLVKAYDDGKNIIYECKMDESEIGDISLLKGHEDEVKESMGDDVFKDPETQHLLMMLNKAEKGLVFRLFGGEPGHTVDLEFTWEELSKYIK